MRVLKKVKQSKNAHKIHKGFFVFDTETTKLEPQPKNFVFGVIYGFNFKKIIYSVEGFKKEFQKKKYQGKYIFAHNCEFDLSAIYGNIYQNLDNSAIFNGSFISARIDKLTFGDSLNIYPSALAKIGELIGLPKLENKKVKNQKLTKNNITKEDIKYCVRDCEIVYEALLRIFTSIGAIKLTISSIAMFNFRNEYLEKDLFFSDLVDEFYESYYGGRTEAFKIGNVKANVYDINSLYPHVMKDAVFPDIKNLKKETKLDLKYFAYVLKNFEGMAKIKVQHLETYFGFIPVRHKIDKHTKLCFPVGIFTTTLNFPEIRFALERGAIKILKVDYIVYSNPIESPFTRFIEENYNFRKETKNSLDKLIYKLKMNSLYGRFAMRMKLQTSYYDLIPYEIMEELDKTEKFYELKLFNQERSDCFLVTENELHTLAWSFLKDCSKMKKIQSYTVIRTLYFWKIFFKEKLGLNLVSIKMKKKM
jgi:hypothetical protein